MKIVCRALTHTVFLLCLSLVATGCATWAKHGVLLEGQKLRVAVLPAEIDFHVKKLKQIETVTNITATAVQRPQIEMALHEVERRVTGTIQQGLTNSYFFAPVPRADVERALAANAITGSTFRLVTNQLQQIARDANADVLLRAKLSGYGAIKGSWLWYLGGMAVGEAIFDAVVSEAATGNIWTGLAVAAEEIGQEGVTTFGGLWLFDSIYTPVILETELVGAKDGRPLWSDTTMDSSNKKAVKRLPESERKKKEVRLRATAELAVADMLKELNKAAAKNIVYDRGDVHAPEQAHASQKPAPVPPPDPNSPVPQ